MVEHLTWSPRETTYKSWCCFNQSFLFCACSAAVLRCRAASLALPTWDPVKLFLFLVQDQVPPGKSLQQRELKKDKLHIMKFLCFLPVVEDCHGNIFFLSFFFFQRINLFSVINVHRTKGENICIKKLYWQHPFLGSQWL